MGWPTMKKLLVTVAGECFEAEFEATGNGDGRDGVLYYFKLKDFVKDRGRRSVSMFRSGTDKVFIEDYDARVETVRLNVLRRAFDSGTFSFDIPVIPNRYHELRLRADDFKPQKKADDKIIRRFIRVGAYYLGFKHSPNGPNLFVDFDCPDDLEYLGAKSEDIGRNVRLLTEEGYLRSAASTYANAWRVLPTAKLIREIENGDGSVSAGSPPQMGANVTQYFHLHGHNPRVNMNSTDNSVNVSSVSGDQLFVQLRETINSIQNQTDKENILGRLEELEKARGTGSFQPAYQNFIASAAMYMGIVGPFIPALMGMLPGRWPMAPLTASRRNFFGHKQLVKDPKKDRSDLLELARIEPTVSDEPKHEWTAACLTYRQ
jgi:hypothetical protein